MDDRTWLDRAIDRVMPWVYLTLRRAPIATLTAVLVALLFFLVPQSREVLAGLGEAPLRSLKDLDASRVPQINFIAFYSYLGAAVMLGLATWYAARLLVTVESERATLPARKEWPIPPRLEFAATWLPRGLGVFVLSAAIGALIYAGATPQLKQGPAIGLALLAVIGPLVMVAGAMQHKLWPVAVGGPAFIAAAIQLLALMKLSLALNDLAAAVLPAALLMFLVKRRALLHELATPAAAARQRKFKDSYKGLLGVLALSVGLLLSLAFVGASTVRLVGSAASVLLFLVAAQLLCVAVHIGLRHMADNVPGLTTVLLLLFAIGVAVVGEESLGTEVLPPPAAQAPGKTVAAMPTRPLVVNAYGGGLRAASFTAQVLASADDASCGRFGKHVAAYSGVSGGSLGIATYLVARQAFVASGGWSEGCQPNSDKRPLTDIVVRTLVQDHLSPAVARMLAVDAPHFWWGPQRGQALLESWQHALLDALETSLGAAHRVGFEQPLAGLNGGLDPAPAVYFNATDADSGHVVWFGNRDRGTVGSHSGGKGPRHGVNVSIGQAVLHSARFPIVSPAGRFDAGERDVGFRRLVDGGYFDNSGTATLLALLPPELAAAPANLRLINLNGNPPDAEPSESKPPILTALRALLQVRSAHAEFAVEQFRLELVQHKSLISRST